MPTRQSVAERLAGKQMANVTAVTDRTSNSLLVFLFDSLGPT